VSFNPKEIEPVGEVRSPDPDQSLSAEEKASYEPTCDKFMQSDLDDISKAIEGQALASFGFSGCQWPSNEFYGVSAFSGAFEASGAYGTFEAYESTTLPPEKAEDYEEEPKEEIIIESPYDRWDFL